MGTKAPSKSKTKAKSTKIAAISQSEHSTTENTDSVTSDASPIQDGQILDPEPNQPKNSVNSPSTASILTIRIDTIEPDPNQPRKFFSPGSLERLKQSIKSTSLIEPILVRENEKDDARFITVDGERRWRACKALNFTEIPCRVMPKDSLDYEIVSFTQNVQREEFTAMEKAIALGKLFNKMKQGNESVEQKELAIKASLSKSYVSDLLRINNLKDNKEILNEVLKSNMWSHSMLMELAKSKNDNKRQNIFEQYKSILGKKSEKLGQTDKEVKPKLVDGADENYARSPSDIEDLDDDINPKLQKFNTYAHYFKVKLAKIKKLEPSPEALERIKPELDEILTLINDIVN
jgi:ParB family chromosome partitioning protein